MLTGPPPKFHGTWDNLQGWCGADWMRLALINMSLPFNAHLSF